MKNVTEKATSMIFAVMGFLLASTSASEMATECYNPDSVDPPTEVDSNWIRCGRSHESSPAVSVMAAVAY